MTENCFTFVSLLLCIAYIYFFCIYLFLLSQSFIMLLRVISTMITIDNLPEMIDDFSATLKTKLGLEGDLVIQYQDPEFDNG